MKLLDRIRLWEEDKREYELSFTNNPYLIAEIGVNHESSLENAKKLCKNAKDSGANAAKFQTYKADKIASKDAVAYWDLKENKVENQKELFSKYDSFDEKDYRELSRYCKEIDIEFMSTPFDTDCLDWLDELVEVFKISSSDITNKILIQRAGKLNKNIILSTGASNIEEINNAINWISEVNNKTIIINHCILNYPTTINNANLYRIKELKSRFPSQIIGYSDHTKPTENLSILQEATSLGALVLEKHFTDDKTLYGNDHFHSMDKIDVENFRLALLKRRELYGSSKIKPLDTEHLSRKMARRSLVLKRDKKVGEKLSFDDLIPKRPATGISPSEIDSVVGKALKVDKEADTVLFFEDIN